MFNGGTITLLLGVLLLTGCQGENFFRRESDPTRGYNLSDVRPYNTDLRRTEDQKLAEVQKRKCGNPFRVTLRGEDTNSTAEFKLGKEKTLEIQIDKMDGFMEPGQAWDVKTMESPCGDRCLKQVSKTDKSALYKFTWTPGNPHILAEPLTLRYFWPIRMECSGVPVTHKIALAVKNETAEDTSAISFPGLRNQVTYGESFTFAVRIDQPGARFSFVDNPEGDNVINGRPAADCKPSGRNVPNGTGQEASVFDCKFDSRALPDEEVQKLLGSGQTATAAFSVALARRGHPVTARVNIQFEKVTSPAPPTKANPPATAKPNKGAK